MRLPQRFVHSVRSSVALRRVASASLLTCVLTLHWAVAQTPAPGAPGGLAAAAGDGTIALTWDDPGDATITGYEYRVYADREQDWREWKEITGTTRRTTDYTLTLTNDVGYRVQLRARNSAGASEPSETSGTPQAPAAQDMEPEATAPAADAPPGAPGGLAATAGDGTIALTWDDPGDATITGYEYRVYADREQDWREWKEITGTTRRTTDYTLTLTNDVGYRVQLRARNSAGASEPSETSGTPQAPGAVGVTEATTADAPAAAESAEEPADGSTAAGETPVIEESPRSGAPWIVIIVLAVCLVAGVVLVATRMRRPAGGSDETPDADTPDDDS